MACCILAAFLIAQFVALLRRWGIFFGVVRPRVYEDGTVTLRGWMRRRLAVPRIRHGLLAAFVLELAVAGIWTYRNHSAHLYRLADESVSRLRGQRVVYVGICTPGNDDRYVRLVLDPPRHALS